MLITIDNKKIMVDDQNKNIVEIGDENGIAITAPCYRGNRKHGCCKACVVEIDGIQKFACGTKPKEGMVIIYDRDDLDTIRKERLEKYAQAITNADVRGYECCGTDPQGASACTCSGTSCCG